MSITIQNHPTGRYQVKLTGDRRLYLVGTLDETFEAIKHYHAKEHNPDACPFCQRAKKDQKKGA